jgi:hypothetical protein
MVYAIHKNILSGTDSKNQDELPALAGVMTPEAHLLNINK